ncbi:MAG: hypothetical protein II458_01885 [Oscillospiraceae bacterium]|nr:hypothetical protein [Oscillospiraceae bacterium]
MADLDNVRSRKWQLTINNPIDHGFDHMTIKDKLHQLKSLVYWCMCDEEGDECDTLHTHVFIALSNACTASRLSNLLPFAHREIVHGSSRDNRAYVAKEGEKFNRDPDGHYSYTDSKGKLHKGINFSDTFEEEGELYSRYSYHLWRDVCWPGYYVSRFQVPVSCCRSFYR